jgi:hypothetical protein
LRGWLAWPGRHEAGDAALADVDAELEQGPAKALRRDVLGGDSNLMHVHAGK